MDSQLPDGATPLDPDEAEALIPSHITTVRALNEWEQANIVSARRWALNTRKDLLSVSGVRELHRRMFDETWRWAGKFRVSDKTIGVPKAMITEAVKNACDDARTWIELSTYDTPELAARLHHRLVHIHPFPNGNGRHARLMTDVVLHRLGRQPATWGTGDLSGDETLRDRYILALRAADRGEFGRLIAFVAG